jgi:omega-hydroxy-beta-dihydromenaquinone-9 sulfotransferase
VHLAQPQTFMKVGPLFIGGTGRSGTTQLARVLGQHPAIHAFPDETRFIVDPGGLEDLARALTSIYSVYHGDDALRRFDHVMRRHATGSTATTFRGWNVPAMVGEVRYWAGLRRLWDDLVWYTFDEAVPTDPYVPAASPFEPTTHRRVIPRYFEDRSELIAVLRRFVDELFGGAAIEAGKRTWCEKTPFNLLSIDFLWELFPTSTFLHIYRHPLNVVASHVHQPWAPNDIQSLVGWLRPIYLRWFAIRDRLAPATNERLIEIRMEDLASNWPERRASLFSNLGLDDFETADGFENAVAKRRDGQLSPDERAYVVDELGWAIERLGYSVDPESLPHHPPH